MIFSILRSILVRNPLAFVKSIFPQNAINKIFSILTRNPRVFSDEDRPLLADDCSVILLHILRKFIEGETNTEMVRTIGRNQDLEHSRFSDHYQNPFVFVLGGVVVCQAVYSTYRTIYLLVYAVDQHN